MSRDQMQIVMKWMASGDTGISSECIAQTAMGNWDELNWINNSPPRDPSDLGRCLRLLKKAPFLREQEAVTRQASGGAE